MANFIKPDHSALGCAGSGLWLQMQDVIDWWQMQVINHRVNFFQVILLTLVTFPYKLFKTAAKIVSKLSEVVYQSLPYFQHN
jgi:hypothetical protein